MRRISPLFQIIGLAIAIPGAAAVVLAQPNTSQPSSIDATRLLVSGRALSADDATKLEKIVEADPKNVAAHISLIAYYSTRRGEDFKARKNVQALWFIRNMPDSDMLRWIIQARLEPILDKEFPEAKQLWLDNLDKYKGNTTVIVNAFDFFKINDKPFAEKLIKQAIALEPGNWQWPMELGHLLMLEVQSANAEMRRSLAARAYEQYSLAYSATKSDSQKPILLSRLPVAAFEAGDLKHAREWSVEVLNQAATNQSASMMGPVHHAQIILGRIALIEGNLAEAKNRLLLAGQTSGSPALKGFGPNMSLAKELLEKGERETVLKYFEECGNFWKDAKLDQWTAKVKAGDMPQFGANLSY
jgi:tetratricopeptide (TPR) repeat protein